MVVPKTIDHHGNITEIHISNFSLFKQYPFADLHCYNYCKTLGGNHSDQHGFPQEYDVNTTKLKYKFLASVV